PSRRTASAVTANIAESGLAPTVMSRPRLRMTSPSSRPWALIHTLCQASMATAASSTAALNSSWPRPSRAAAMRPAKAATTQAPATPRTMPPRIQRPRPSAPRLAPITTAMMSAASSTSRKTMMAEPSTVRPFLPGDQLAFGGGFVVLAHEFVDPGLERPHPDRRLAVAGDHLLAVELVTFELFGRRVLVVHDKLHFLAGGYRDFGRREAMVFDNEGVLGLVSCAAHCRCGQQDQARQYCFQVIHVFSAVRMSWILIIMIMVLNN